MSALMSTKNRSKPSFSNCTSVNLRTYLGVLALAPDVNVVELVDAVTTRIFCAGEEVIVKEVRR